MLERYLGFGKLFRQTVYRVGREGMGALGGKGPLDRMVGR